MIDFNPSRPNSEQPNLSGITGIVRRLVLDGALSEENARKALAEAPKTKLPVHVFLAEKKLISAASLALANAAEFGLPLLDATALDLKQCPLKLVNEELIHKHKVLPLFKRGNRLFIGTSEPANTKAIDEIRFHANMVVEMVLIDHDQLAQTIDRALAAGDNLAEAFGEEEGLDLDTQSGDDEESGAASVDAASEDTPTVKFINKVL